MTTPVHKGPLRADGDPGSGVRGPHNLDPELVGKALLALRQRRPKRPLHEIADQLFSARKWSGAAGS